MQTQQIPKPEYSIGRPRSVRRQSDLSWFFRHIGRPYLFLAPFLVLFIVFFLLPIGYAFYISLFSDRLVGGDVFTGVQNYVQAWQDANFWEGIRHMALFGLVQVPIMLGLALIFALLLDRGVKHLRTLFRLGFFLPYAIPSVIAALMWGYLYGPSFGPFAQIANSLHLPAPAFLSSSGMLASIGNIVTWQWTGYNMIILFAALQAVPAEVYDAATVDGANRWHVAWHIQIPLIAPALILTAVLAIIGTLQLFNEPSIMYAIAPNVIGDHYTPNFYAYTLAFTNQQYNYSAAISFTLGALIFVCSYLFILSTGRRRQG